MSAPLLAASGLRREYRARGHSRGVSVRALDGVDLDLEPGCCLAVVGESGSGKSTLARLLIALERPDEGTVSFDGQPISDMSPSEVRPLRRRFQAVFQDPSASLDPRLSVRTSVAEPLTAHGIGNPSHRRSRVEEALLSVGLEPAVASRRPAALSSGQRQRVAIARALVTEPELLVLDEPLSSLDALTQTQILALLAGLRQRHGLTMLLISHDLRMVRSIADRVMVLYRGRVVELGSTDRVLTSPAHPYTRALQAALPDRHVRTAPLPPATPARLDGWTEAACRYAPRCPEADDDCQREPGLLAIGDSHNAACWRTPS